MGQDPAQIRREIEQTRADMGETVQALGYKTDVKARTRDKVVGTKESVKGKVVGTKNSVKEKIAGPASTVSDKTPSGGDVRDGARQAVGIAQENPLGLAVGALAVGFLAGMAAPTTRVEDEKIGPLADEVKDRAKETGQEALEHGKQVAQETAHSAQETAQQSGQQHAQELKTSTQQAAQEVRGQS